MNGLFEEVTKAIWGDLPRSHVEAFCNASRVHNLLFEFAVRSYEEMYKGKDFSKLLQIMAIRRRIGTAIDLLLAKAEQIQ